MPERNVFEESAIATLDLLLLGVWFGLAYGLTEAILLLSLYEFSPLLMWRNGVAPPILWIGPAINLGLFFLAGCILAVLSSLAGKSAKGWAWPLAFALFCGAAAFGLLMAPLALQTWGCAVAAVGVAVQVFRWARRHFVIGFLRRTLVPLLIVVGVAGVGGAVWPKWRERESLRALPRPRAGYPNVLLIILDTQRADHLSSYGYARQTTPNLDRLASEGVLFEKAFSPSTSTPPSHLALLSGQTLRGDWYYGVRHQRFQPLISETAAKQGYATIACVANSLWCTPKVGLGRGFVRFDVYFHSAADAFTRTFYGKVLAYIYRWWLGYFDLPGRKRAEEVNRELLEWIDRVRPSGRPFFAMLNYFDVHDPYIAPPPFRTQFSSRVTRKSLRALYRGSGLRPDLPLADVQLLIDAYDGSLVYLDHALGELRKELERRGLLDETLIIVTADHGEALGEFGQFGHVKPDLRQEVTHVPLILRYPPRVPAGLRVPHPVSLRQIPVTIADVLGLGSGLSYEGRSLLARLEAPQEPVLVEAGPDRAVVFQQWHFILKDSKPQLYNLENDPREMTNLSGRPETARIEAQLRGQLAALTKGYEAMTPRRNPTLAY